MNSHIATQAMIVYAAERKRVRALIQDELDSGRITDDERNKIASAIFQFARAAEEAGYGKAYLRFGARNVFGEFMQELAEREGSE